MWVVLALVSAVLLGVYDVFKKLALNNNAVLPVLFISTLTSSAIFLPLVILSYYFPDWVNASFFVPSVSAYQQVLIFIKSIIVVSSWIFAFYAMKYLPITIVSPIRGTGPLWVLLGAIAIFGEHLNGFQWVGVLITLFFFYMLSTAGKLEGIYFTTNRWVIFILVGTLLGAGSSLYDKYIMRQVDRMAVQAWFSFYQSLIMVPVLAVNYWKKPFEKRDKFEFRWSIPAIGLFLVMSDFVYFYALSYEDSMISMISALRRGGVVISFLIGTLIFTEKNIVKKGLYLAGILLGIILITIGSHLK
jgi:transporter family protein